MLFQKLVLSCRMSCFRKNHGIVPVFNNIIFCTLYMVIYIITISMTSNCRSTAFVQENAKWLIWSIVWNIILSKLCCISQLKDSNSLSSEIEQHLECIVSMYFNSSPKFMQYNVCLCRFLNMDINYKLILIYPCLNLSIINRNKLILAL